MLPLPIMVLLTILQLKLMPMNYPRDFSLKAVTTSYPITQPIPSLPTLIYTYSTMNILNCTPSFSTLPLTLSTLPLIATVTIMAPFKNASLYSIGSLLLISSAFHIPGVLIGDHKKDSYITIYLLFVSPITLPKASM
jgi:hypothetical protein